MIDYCSKPCLSPLLTGFLYNTGLELKLCKRFCAISYNTYCYCYCNSCCAKQSLAFLVCYNLPRFVISWLRNCKTCFFSDVGRIDGSQRVQRSRVSRDERFLFWTLKNCWTKMPSSLLVQWRRGFRKKYRTVWYFAKLGWGGGGWRKKRFIRDHLGPF